MKILLLLLYDSNIKNSILFLPADLATPLTINFNVQEGYFSTENWDLLCDYVLRCLRQWRSLTLRIHVSAIFMSNEDALDSLHGPITREVFDLEHGIEHVADRLDDILQNILSNEENYQNFQGSGWTFIAIDKYWFSLAPYQPNEPIRDVEQRQMHNEGNRNEQGRVDIPRRRHNRNREQINSFIKALAQANAQSTNRREWIRHVPDIKEMFDNQPDITEADRLYWQRVGTRTRLRRIIASNILSHRSYAESKFQT